MAAIGGALVIFGAFMAAKGVDPVEAYRDMFERRSPTGNSSATSSSEAPPLVLAALAVAVPARAGLVNVGGEGQLVIGGVAAAGVVARLDGSAARRRHARAA